MSENPHYTGEIEIRCKDQDELYQLLQESQGGIILDLDLHVPKKRPFLRVYDNTIYQITVFEDHTGEEPELRFETGKISKEDFYELTSDTTLYYRLLPRSETPFSKEVQSKFEEEYTPDFNQ